MKYCFNFAVIVAAVLSLISCGTTNSAATKKSNPYGEIMASNECIELAEGDPVRRQYGLGQHFKEQTAGNLAEANARASFARKISTAIAAGTESTSVQLEKYTRNDKNGTSVADESSETGDFLTSISQEIIKNTSTIKTIRYYNSEAQQWTIFKCLEFLGTKDAMVEQIIETLKDNISKEDRAAIESRHDQLRQRILQTLAK